MALVLDSSGIIALLNSADRAHAVCVAAASLDAELVVPALTLVEVEYWCRKAGALESYGRFVDDVRAGAYQLAPLTIEVVTRARELGEAYRDLGLGIVDASVVATAESLDVTRVLTLDRRDFSVVRPSHCAALELLPG